jgi:hypothetical protein
MTLRKATKGVPGVAQGLLKTLLSVALALLGALDSHVESTEVVLELEVNRSLCCGQVHLNNLLRRRDLVNLSNVLRDIPSARKDSSVGSETN